MSPLESSPVASKTSAASVKGPDVPPSVATRTEWGFEADGRTTASSLATVKVPVAESEEPNSPVTV